MTGESLNSAMLGGTQCPDTAAGHWLFFSTPDDTGSSFADDKFTSGDYIALPIDDPKASCLLSALIRRDEHGLNLCLVEDPDSDCSAKELLRRGKPRHQAGHGIDRLTSPPSKRHKICDRARSSVPDWPLCTYAGAGRKWRST